VRLMDSLRSLLVCVDGPWTGELCMKHHVYLDAAPRIGAARRGRAAGLPPRLRLASRLGICPHWHCRVLSRVRLWVCGGP